jgi:hypothetical protein
MLEGLHLADEFVNGPLKLVGIRRSSRRWVGKVVRGRLNPSYEISNQQEARHLHANYIKRESIDKGGFILTICQCRTPKTTKAEDRWAKCVVNI